MTESQEILSHAQRVYDDINKAAEHPAASLTKLPGLSKYLAKVLLLIVGNQVRLEDRLKKLEDQHAKVN